MKKLILELTHAEALCLAEMASQVAEHWDVLRQEFPNAKRRATAERVYDKLNAVIHASDSRGKNG